MSDMNKPVRPMMVLVKALFLFVLVNIVAVYSELPIGKISAYNIIYPGRQRLPFGEDQSRAYNLSLFDLDAMFASHELSAPELGSSYRVILIGDSSVWGTLLTPDQTLAGQLNASDFSSCKKQMQFFNVGYPTISLTKDLLMLHRSLSYHPDMIIWLTTLEAFPRNRQLESPIVANNVEEVRYLIDQYHIDLNISSLDEPTLLDKTIIGRRRALADLLRLQLYGTLWASTGIDQYYPSSYPAAQVDLEADKTFHELNESDFEGALAFDVLSAGQSASGDVPIIFVNEPILISDGANSNIRYNFYYPRWAYDQFRSIMNEKAMQEGWQYLDLWDVVPAKEFTNSAIHLTLKGENLLAIHLRDVILQNCDD